MDECEQEEKYLGRMGYDRYRYSNGRFAPKGRGSRMGCFVIGVAKDVLGNRFTYVAPVGAERMIA